MKNITDKTKIESLKFMLSASDSPEKVIEKIAKVNQLTEEFVLEFYPYITPEIFSSSYKLTADLADRFPELFNIEIHLAQPVASWHITMFYRNKVDIKHFLEQEAATEEDILEVLRTTEDEYFSKVEYIAPFIGLSEAIDELLLLKIKDTDLLKTIIMKQAIEGKNMTARAFEVLDSDLKESVLGTENIEVDRFLKAISITKDLGWKISMLNKLENDEITFHRYTGTADDELMLLCSGLQENLILKLTKIKKYAPNLFTNKVLHALLTGKDFSEGQLIELIPLYVKSTAIQELRSYADKHEMTQLKEAIKNYYKQ